MPNQINKQRMRVEIKTNGKVKDNDIKAIYLLREAIKISTPRMIKANLDFALGKHFTITPKQ